MTDPLWLEALAEIEAAEDAGMDPDTVLAAELLAAIEKAERRSGRRLTYRDVLKSGLPR